MRVLVVGGAGYVGCVLVEELLSSGYDVRVLDRLYFGNYLPEQVDLIIGDMRSFQLGVLDGIGAVINVGGLSNDPTAEMWPEANIQINAVATRKLAEDCKDCGISKFVFASTCSIYDRGLNEHDDMLLSEDCYVYPTYPYSKSKLEAEYALLRLADECFCPVILRKGTIYGYSPRMRYDLVVNTMVAHALSRGYITVFNGGEMWRPLIDVRDVAKAYIACLEADADKVRGQIFNISYKNYRVSELALRVRRALLEIGVDIDIRADYREGKMRSYRVSTDKARDVLGFIPTISVEDSIKYMVGEKIAGDDFSDPRYYNIRWMKLLKEAKGILDVTGEVF